MSDVEFAALCAEQYPRLVGALRLQVRDDHVAEDLAQETLARAYRDWEHVRRLTSVPAWLFRVAFNLANSHHRRQVVRWRAHRRMADPPPDEAVRSSDDSLVVGAALARLAPRMRQALILRYYADLSVATVAALMRCPESTIKTLTRRGLQQLRAQPEFAKVGEDRNG